MRLFLTLVAASLIFAQPSYGGDLWGADYKKAFEAARKNKKPVLLKFSATWCGTCTQMQKGPLADKGIQGSIQSMNAIALDVDKFKDLTKRYQVQGLPTLLFMTPSGVIFKRTELFVEKDKLSDVFASAQKQSDALEAKLSGLKAAAQKDPEDRSDLAQFYLSHGNLSEAATVYRSIFDDSKIGAHPRQKAGIRVIDALYRMEQFDKAFKVVKATVALNPHSSLSAHALFLKGFIFEAQEKLDEARKVYQELEKSFPKSRGAKAASQRLKELRGQ